MSRKRPKSNGVEQQMVRSLDQLAMFEQFQDDVLPELAKMLRQGASAEDIFKFSASAAAARGVTIALKEKDPSKALAAIKDVLDRSGGKARESRDVTHRLEKLPEDQLDSLIMSKLGDGDEETLN